MQRTIGMQERMLRTIEMQERTVERAAKEQRESLESLMHQRFEAQENQYRELVTRQFQEDEQRVAELSRRAWEENQATEDRAQQFLHQAEQMAGAARQARAEASEELMRARSQGAASSSNAPAAAWSHPQLAGTAALPTGGETTEKASIDETDRLWKAVDKMCGLWFRGRKYSIVRAETDFDVTDGKVDIITAARSKGGVHLIKTKENPQVLAVFYDEEAGQASGPSKAAAISFAEYLVSKGF